MKLQWDKTPRNLHKRWQISLKFPWKFLTPLETSWNSAFGTPLKCHKDLLKPFLFFFYLMPLRFLPPCETSLKTPETPLGPPKILWTQFLKIDFFFQNHLGCGVEILGRIFFSAGVFSRSLKKIPCAILKNFGNKSLLLNTHKIHLRNLQRLIYIWMEKKKNIFVRTRTA